MKIKVLIVDDEAPARVKLRKALEPQEDFEVIGEAQDGREAVAMILEKKPNLVFLDVQMPLLDGFGVLEEVGAENFEQVVFVTAFDEYALKAFEAEAFDYLLKPWAPSRLIKVLARIRKERQRQAGPDLASRLEALLAGAARESGLPTRPLQRLLLTKEDEREFLLAVDQIDFIRAAANYLEFHTQDGILRRRMTLYELEARLDPDRFLRINRSEIVRMEAIAEVEPLFHGDSRVKLKSGKILSWSRRYRARAGDRF